MPGCTNQPGRSSHCCHRPRLGPRPTPGVFVGRVRGRPRRSRRERNGTDFAEPLGGRGLLTGAASLPSSDTAAQPQRVRCLLTLPAREQGGGSPFHCSGVRPSPHFLTARFRLPVGRGWLLQHPGPGRPHPSGGERRGRRPHCRPSDFGRGEAGGHAGARSSEGAGGRIAR